MNLAENARPNLKPFRDVDPHNVVGLFAHTLGVVNKGTLVTVTSGEANTNVMQNAISGDVTPYLKNVANPGLDNLPSYVYSNQNEISFKVGTSTSGDSPLGFTLNDVRTQDAWSQDMHWQHQKRAEGDIVESGQPVNILTKGLLLVNGIQGTPDHTKGAYTSFTVDGEIDVATLDKTRADYVGKFLTSKDADGYALLKVEL